MNNRHIPIIFSETLEEDFRRTNKRDLLIEFENERKKLVKSKQPIDWGNWFDLIRKHEMIGKIGVATAMLAFICFPVALEFLFMRNATIVAPLAGIGLPGWSIEQYAVWLTVAIVSLIITAYFTIKNTWTVIKYAIKYFSKNK